MKTVLSLEPPALKRRHLWRNLRLFLLLALAGCSPGKTEKISILGSNTIGEELAPRLATEFHKEHPAVVFDLEFKGTSYGMGALMVEQCDIAAASRELTSTERELARDRSIQFNDYVIGSYSVAVIVNANNPMKNLTRDQVRDIFSGTVQNWKEFGGPDEAIHLYIRDPISGTHLGFQELAMDKKPYADHFKSLTNYAAIVDAVAKDTAGIGYVSFNLTGKPGIKAITVGGVEPTATAVGKGQYPYARVLRLYTIKTKETPVAREFVNFVLSAHGQQIMNEMGFIAHP